MWRRPRPGPARRPAERVSSWVKQQPPLTRPIVAHRQLARLITLQRIPRILLGVFDQEVGVGQIRLPCIRDAKQLDLAAVPARGRLAVVRHQHLPTDELAVLLLRLELRARRIGEAGGRLRWRLAARPVCCVVLLVGSRMSPTGRRGKKWLDFTVDSEIEGRQYD